MGDIELQLFSERLKELRLSLNMTQKDFADKIDVTAAALSAYENNQKNPSIAVAKRIAETFKISLDWLCGIGDQKKLNKKIETYADLIRIINQIIETEYLDANLTLISDPNYDGDPDTTPALGAIVFDNYTCTEIIVDWIKYRNIGNDQALNENINSMWVEKACQRYANDTLELPFD